MKWKHQELVQGFKFRTFRPLQCNKPKTDNSSSGITGTPEYSSWVSSGFMLTISHLFNKFTGKYNPVNHLSIPEPNPGLKLPFPFFQHNNT